MSTFRRRMIMSFKKTGRLPSTYQEVEYLESTGTQYIDTQYIPDSATKLVYKYEQTQEIIYPEAYVLFGSRNNGNGYPGIAMGVSYSGTGFRFGGKNYKMLTDFSGLSIHNCILEFRKISVDGIIYSDDTNLAWGNLYYSLTLFGNHEANKILAKASKLRIYIFQIYNNSTIVRDFIPCYRKADGEIGLYDLVNNVFYTNAGTGTFKKGADV